MDKRNTLRLLPGLLALCACLTLPAAASGATDDSGLGAAEAREEYRAALADLYAVRLRDFEIRLERLEDYPLLPYLHYAHLMRYISAATPEDVSTFRTRFAETPLADQAQREWLENLARRGQWQTFAAGFDPTVPTSDTLDCHHARALLATGDTAAAFERARELWLVDHSQPKACDPLFDAWQRAGGISDELAWQRFELALQAGRQSLASYLIRYLEAASRPLAEQYVALHRSPHRLVRMDRLPGSDQGARELQVIAHTIRRLARRDAVQAEAQWERWSERLTFTPAQRSAVREDLVRYRARQNQLPEGFVSSWPPPDLVADTATDLIEELTRDAVRGQRWDEVGTWVNRMPDWARDAPAWQYWAARAQLERAADRSAAPTVEATGQSFVVSDPGPWETTAEGDTVAPLRVTTGARVIRSAPMATPVETSARARLTTLAEQRNFYGFLAADRTGKPYALERAAMDLTSTEVDAVAQHPAMRRALELNAIGEATDARRELNWLLDTLSDRELLALAEYTRRLGWHRESIRAAIAAEHWDQVDLRFPLAYSEPMLEAAGARQLQPSWLYAIARQESAFMADARSSAGALGLMQVMPSTARLTAKRLNIPFSSSWQLLDERTNIQIGSGYLKQMYDRFDHNRILASAAYNAGPNRVDRWIVEQDPNPADVWIEGIPYRETRNYVQNVLAFSLIYSIQLGEAQPFLYENEH
ncbi:MAG TPA: transglycosylase SLT domain-containing protein [Pseudomonadales bacterium]|nr:transglycosylase SLT domain-containing protein [Pseudomonadales bacterium]